MSTIQWRPAVNGLTVPQSYRPRFLPRSVVGYQELAEEVAREHPYYSEEMVRTVMKAMNEKIQQHLINGDQVTLENAFIYRTAFRARLDNPNAPLPDNKDLLRVRVFPSRNLVDQVRRKARFEKMPMVEKIPLIASASDTFLLLNNVLYGRGVLRLVGASLAFDPMEEDCGCVIEGTSGDSVAQSRFAMISNSTLLLVPDIPAPPAPWNNEYTVTVSSRYSEHGTRRTGVYRRKLRMPLLITDFDAPGGTGILTGDAASPYVSIIGGVASAQGMVRIQVVREAGVGGLLFSLLDMQEGGEVGPAVRMDGVGDCLLAGFTGSPLTALHIRVHAYANLAKMIRNVYAGRLVDILEMGMAG